jgi:hypothetical protein
LFPFLIGLRFSALQGSSLLDCTVRADGAFAGFSDCPGQGGGTYNIETIGGRYGITIDAASRFPILTGCKFTGQTVACVGYRGSIQVPTLMIGCQLEPDGFMAVDFSENSRYAGINMVDFLVALKPGGFVAMTRKTENLHIDSSYVQGAKSRVPGGEPLPVDGPWTRIDEYSSGTGRSTNLINGVASAETVARWHAAAAPSFETLRAKHYRPVPCFDEDGVSNVKDFGAKGDGQTDDTDAFRKAIAQGDKVFVPKGDFRLEGTLQLGANTHLFGLTRTYSNLGNSESRFGQRRSADTSFSIVTVDDPDAAPGFSHLGIRGDIQCTNVTGVR